MSHERSVTHPLAGAVRYRLAAPASRAPVTLLVRDGEPWCGLAAVLEGETYWAEAALVEDSPHPWRTLPAE